MRQRDRVRLGEETRRLADGDRTIWLRRAGDVGLDAKDWSRRGGEGGVNLGGRVFERPLVARLQGLLLESLQSFHEHNPLALGAHRRELHRDRLGHLDSKVFDDLVESLSQASSVQFDGPLVRIASFEVRLTAEQLALKDDLQHAIDTAGTAGLAAKPLHMAFPQPEVAALLRLLDRE
jgi:hypothetical protein